MSKTVDLAPVCAFLPCLTPATWAAAAVNDLETLLIDHANCEKKAAATALSLMHRYTENSGLLHAMSRLAREELRHFEQVLKIMERRGIEYRPVTASRYASGLHGLIRVQEPYKLIDTLLVGALIEARSCERFAALVPLLDEELGGFYTSLLRSESRHFMDYLGLAKSAARAAGCEDDIDDRLQAFKEREAELILNPDDNLRFHSGIPRSASAEAADAA